jgi:hypothetical protein
LPLRRLLLLASAAVLFACGSDGGGSGSDSGVDASEHHVLLRWSRSPGVAGYVVHWGTSSGEYGNALDVGDPPSGDGVASFELDVGGPGGPIYFALTSYDDQGRMSSFSNELAAVVP